MNKEFEKNSILDESELGAVSGGSANDHFEDYKIADIPVNIPVEPEKITPTNNPWGSGGGILVEVIESKSDEK